MNSNGPGFGLWVALPAGGALVQLPVLTSVVAPLENGDFGLFPNPASSNLAVRFNVEKPSVTTLVLRDFTGRVILNQNLGRTFTGEHTIELDVNNIPSGTYLMELQSNEQRLTKKVQVIR
jgi:hypothetical protein